MWGSAGERANSSQVQQAARRNALLRDSQLLEHEQIHFDIAEATVREIKARFADFESACAEAGGTDPIRRWSAKSIASSRQSSSATIARPPTASMRVRRISGRDGYARF